MPAGCSGYIQLDDGSLISIAYALAGWVVRGGILELHDRRSFYWKKKISNEQRGG